MKNNYAQFVVACVGAPTQAVELSQEAMALDRSKTCLFLACAISREWGHEPGDSLKGKHRGCCIGVIPTFPAEHQQVVRLSSWADRGV